MLKKIGCTSVIANNGIEALELLENKEFDLILMDCSMPKMDGYETTTVIRENPKLSKNIIIALTANTTKEDRQKYINVGMDDFIAKPFEQKLLYEHLLMWKEKIN